MDGFGMVFSFKVSWIIFSCYFQSFILEIGVICFFFREGVGDVYFYYLEFSIRFSKI